MIIPSIAVILIIAMLALRFWPRRTTRTASSVQTQTTSSTAPPVTPTTKQTSGKGGWLGFAFGVVLVLSICASYHFWPSGNEGKKPAIHLTLNYKGINNYGVGIYGREGITLLPGEYQTNQLVDVYPGESPVLIATGATHFSLSKKTDITIVALHQNITITPQ